MREVERSEGPAPTRTDLVRRPYGDRPIEVVSGDRTYRIVGAVSPAEPTRGRGLWEIVVRDAEGAETTHRLGAPGDELFELSVTADRAGAILLYFAERRREGNRGLGSLVLLEGPTPVFARDVPVHWGELPLRLERIPSGWLVVAPERSRALAVWRVAEDGAIVDSAPLETTREVAIGEGHGAIGVARANVEGVPTVLFSLAARGQISEPIEIDFDGGLWAPRLRPAHVVAAPDGWWVAIEATWRDTYGPEAPTQWRFVHLDPSGAPTGRADVRWDGWAGELDSVRAEDGGLRGAHGSRSGSSAQPTLTRTTFVVEPRGPCRAEALTSCSPRVWPRSERSSWPPPPGWRSTHQHEVGSSLLRLDTRGEARWALRPAPAPIASEPAGFAGLDYLLVGRPDQRARMLVLDDRNGELLEVHDPDVENVRRGCLAASQDGVFVGLATDRELHLFRVPHGAPARIEPRLVVEGSFSECTIAVMPNRVVVGTVGVENDTSARPLGSVQLHVLSRDAASLHRTLVPREPEGVDVRTFVDEHGVAIVWRDPSGLHETLWRLDPGGRPMGAPRHLTTIWGFRIATLVSTEIGPGLAWSTWNEAGFVPFCSADESHETQPR